jgi:hypothetical protein
MREWPTTSEVASLVSRARALSLSLSLSHSLFLSLFHSLFMPTKQATPIVTSSPPHLLTSSPPHLLTSSPPHLLTSSPPHLLTFTCFTSTNKRILTPELLGARWRQSARLWREARSWKRCGPQLMQTLPRGLRPTPFPRSFCMSCNASTRLSQRYCRRLVLRTP